MDLDVVRVQRDRGAVCSDIEIDCYLSCKCKLLEVWFKGDIVVSRDDIGGQHHPSLGVNAASCIVCKFAHCWRFANSKGYWRKWSSCLLYNRRESVR